MRWGVTRQALNNLVNGKSGISPEVAIRLDLPSPKRSFSFAQAGKAFGGGAEISLGLQMDYDLAEAMKHERAIKVKRLREAA